MKGRWAAGIVPRNFAWILKGQLAVSERPGGYAPHHRRVRRQEELLWLAAQGFTRVVSLLPSSHNLHAYEEQGLPSSHFPLAAQSDVRAVLEDCYPALLGWLRRGEVVLVHQEELGERVAGVAAGFLCWSGVLPQAPQAISAVEQLLKRQMGSAGRAIVGEAATLPGPGLAPAGAAPGPAGLVPEPPAPPSEGSEVTPPAAAASITALPGRPRPAATSRTAKGRVAAAPPENPATPGEAAAKPSKGAVPAKAARVPRAGGSTAAGGLGAPSSGRSAPTAKAAGSARGRQGVAKGSAKGAPPGATEVATKPAGARPPARKGAASAGSSSRQSGKER